MQGFSGKLTTYDFLGMLIPGIVVVFCFCRLFYPSVIFESDIRYYCGYKITVIDSQTAIGQVCGAVVFLSASYVVGLTVNCISGLIFGRFRNNELHINLARLLFWKRQFGTNESPGKTPIFKLYFKPLLQIFGCRKKVYSAIEKQYYRNYYWLLNHNKLSGAIPIMEAQVAFVRNMVLPTLLLAIVLFVESITELLPNLPVILLLIFGVIGELYIMYARQMRVYDVVFEDYYWYKKIKDENSIDSNH